MKPGPTGVGSQALPRCLFQGKYVATSELCLFHRSTWRYKGKCDSCVTPVSPQVRTSRSRLYLGFKIQPHIAIWLSSGLLLLSTLSTVRFQRKYVFWSQKNLPPISSHVKRRLACLVSQSPCLQLKSVSVGNLNTSQWMFTKSAPNSFRLHFRHRNGIM